MLLKIPVRSNINIWISSCHGKIYLKKSTVYPHPPSPTPPLNLKEIAMKSIGWDMLRYYLIFSSTVFPERVWSNSGVVWSLNMRTAQGGGVEVRREIFLAILK